MDEAKEGRWRTVLLGSLGYPANEYYRWLSATLLLTIMGGLLFFRVLALSALLPAVQQTNWADFPPLSILIPMINSHNALLLLLGELFAWYLLHRLFSKKFQIITTVAVFFLGVNMAILFIVGVLGSVILSAFTLLVILLYPVINWTKIIVIFSIFLLAKLSQPLALGRSFSITIIFDDIAIGILLIFSLRKLHRLSDRYQSKLKEASERLEQFRTIRSLLGNGLLMIDRNLCIKNHGNRQAKYLFGTPFQKGSFFPDVIVELTQQENYLREQILSFFNSLQIMTLSEIERSRINPMKKLRIFYPGGCKYLCIDAKKIDSQKDVLFMVSINDISSQVELNKSRKQWLLEEFQSAEILRSILISSQSLIDIIRGLRQHYLTVDRLIFEERHQRSTTTPPNLREFLSSLGIELQWFFDTLNTYKFSYLASKATTCKEQADECLITNNYYDFLNLLTRVNIFLLELRQLRKIMLNIQKVHQNKDQSLLLDDEKQHLITLIKHLWIDLDRPKIV